MLFFSWLCRLLSVVWYLVWDRVMLMMLRKLVSVSLVVSVVCVVSESGWCGGGCLVFVVVVVGDGKVVFVFMYGFDGFDGVFGVEFVVQVFDEYFEYVGIVVEVLLIDVFGQVGFGDQFVGMQYQVFEYFVFVVGEVDWFVFDCYCLCGGVQFDWVVCQYWFGLVVGVMYQCVDVCQQFFDVEWFDQIVVGVVFEVFYFVLLVVVGGQDEDGIVLVGFVQ